MYQDDCCERFYRGPRCSGVLRLAAFVVGVVAFTILCFAAGMTLCFFLGKMHLLFTGVSH